MSSPSPGAPPSRASSSSSLPLRLCRGWVAGWMDQERVAFLHRRRTSDCCMNGERAWLLTEGDMFLAAFFHLPSAQRVRDTVNRLTALLGVDHLSARLCKDDPARVEVGLFRAHEFKHLIQLDLSSARVLLISLRESLEDSASLLNAPFDRTVDADFLERHGIRVSRFPTEQQLPPRLHVPASAWKDVSSRRDRSVLMTTVLIAGVPHHLKAIHVQTQQASQSAVESEAENELADMHAACGASSPFETVHLDGREYVMTLTPHAR
jgi:hypothetical protein